MIIIGLFIGLVLSLQYKPVQSYFGQRAARFLSKELQADIRIESIYFKPFSSLQLKQLYVSDQLGDTLFYAGGLDARLNLAKLFQNQVTVNRIRLENATLSFANDSNGNNNLQFIIDYFSPSSPRPKRQKLKLDLAEIDLANLAFRYKKLNSSLSNHSIKIEKIDGTTKTGSSSTSLAASTAASTAASPAASPAALPAIDFEDLWLTELYGSFSSIEFGTNTISGQIKNLRFKEKSGFILKDLSARGKYTQQELELSDLHLETNQSIIKDYIRLNYENMAAFKDFIQQVELNAELEESRISSSDIAFFAPDLHKLFFDVQLKGNFTGTVANLTGTDIHLATSNDTHLSGQLKMRGLPDIQTTVFEIDAKELITNIEEIETLVPQLSERIQFDLPEIMDHLGMIQFKGKLIGHYHDFQVLGALNTDLGAIENDLHIRLANGSTFYEGELIAEDFNLGEFVATKQLGQTAFIARVEGQDFEPSNRVIQIEMHVPRIEFLNYSYRQIHSELTLIGNQLSGEVEVIDPNLRLLMRGNSSIHADSIVHDIGTTIYYADLKRTNLLEKDSIIIHSAAFSSQLVGTNFNNVIGSVRASDILFEHQRAKERKLIHELSAIAREIGASTEIESSKEIGASSEMAASNEIGASSEIEVSRELEIQSDFLNAQIVGDFKILALPEIVKGLAAQYIPALEVSGIDLLAQNFDISIETKDLQLISEVFAPTLYVAPKSTFRGAFKVAHSNPSLRSTQSGNLNPAPNSTPKSNPITTSTFEVNIPELRYGNIKTQKVLVNQQGLEEESRIQWSFDTIRIREDFIMPHVRVHQELKANKIAYEISFKDTLKYNETDLKGNWTILGKEVHSIQSHRSKLVINDQKWDVEPFQLSNSANLTEITSFKAINGVQAIEVGGKISSAPTDELQLRFSSFEVSTLNPFIPNFNYELSGNLNGSTSLRTLLDKPYATANLFLNDLSIDEHLLGNLSIDADFDQQRNYINVALSLDKNNKQEFFVGGTYQLGQQENNLNLQARFDETDLGILNVLLKNLVSDVGGSMTGEAAIHGRLNELIINGEAKLNNAQFTVNYLKTPYRTNGNLSMVNTEFVLNDLLLIDPRNQEARVSGSIRMENPTKPAIRAYIQTNNFLVLNTRYSDNPLYYGTAYGTGRFSFEGVPDDMYIQINARTEDQTVFNIPLNTALSLGAYEFIRFTKFNGKQSNQEVDPFKNKSNGLRLQMDLTMTPAALANIQTDLGELSGRGDGQLALRMSSQGDFEMFGDYYINSGKFTFTAQDFINKIFEIKQGGSIRWSGKPSDATIGLTAYYEQRTSLSPLYNAAGRASNEQRVTARAEMDLNGNLMRPNISFGLDFPSDPYVNDELQGYLSDVNNINQQALSLIIRRSFSPGSTTDLSREVNSTLLNAGSELAFNQINNLISQSLNLNFIDFNIRSLNDASASLRLFNDRLLFTGGIIDLRQQQLNDWNVFQRDGIATDAELIYLIRKDGRLLLRGSNRLNTRRFLLNPTDEYISALGLIYRREFDSLKEFFRSRK